MVSSLLLDERETAANSAPKAAAAAAGYGFRFQILLPLMALLLALGEVIIFRNGHHLLIQPVVMCSWYEEDDEKRRLLRFAYETNNNIFICARYSTLINTFTCSCSCLRRSRR